jgi:transmembrane sensor
MRLTNSEIERLFVCSLSGIITDADKEILNEWTNESDENQNIFNEFAKAWEAALLLKEMEEYNSFEALQLVHGKMDLRPGMRLWNYFQRAAAILLLPLLCYAFYLSMHGKQHHEKIKQEVIQRIVSRQGTVSQITLEDGTRVWLNSGAEIEFPLHFSERERDVAVKGEAFFEVTSNKRSPFIVKLNHLNVKVLGTSFNVASFEDDGLSEVVLVQGEVEFSTFENGILNNHGLMRPGQMVVYNGNNQQIEKKEVTVDKYSAWRDGYIIFRDDTMEEVTKRLGRWFNVEFIIEDEELSTYTYQATFKNESLDQVLNLLKLSSPIDYRVVPRKPLPNGEFSKQKVIIMKRKT